MENLKNFEAPPFLVQVVTLDENGSPRGTRGSGILLAADWALTARHVVQSMPERNRPHWEDLPRKPAVRCRGRCVEIAEIIPDGHADIAVVRLTESLEGPYAELVTGLHDRDRALIAPVTLICIGHRGDLPVEAGASCSRWFTEYQPHWDTASKELQDIQFSGGAPEGFSGGPLCLRLHDHLGVVGLLTLGGVRSASSRAWAMPRILRLLQGVQGLEATVVQYRPSLLDRVSALLRIPVDWTRRLLVSIRQLGFDTRRLLPDDMTRAWRDYCQNDDPLHCYARAAIAAASAATLFAVLSVLAL